MIFDPAWDAAWGGFLGLLIGSFLNVVIYRVPRMMERQWLHQAASHLSDANALREAQTLSETDRQALLQSAPRLVQALDAAPAFSLMRPASRCPACGHQVRWYENIPVVSWIALRGKCSACSARIGIRYPMVELLTGALFYFCIYRWGATPAGLAWCVFAALLVAMAFIDWDTTLLPDDLTYPFLWAGLLGAAYGVTEVTAMQALTGAAVGYLSLWSLYWGFKLLTGREGMGYGDFKLLAGLGAWFGVQGLLPIVLVSSIIGAIVGIAMKFSTGLREGGYVPYGPFLAGAGFMALFFGADPLMQAILRGLFSVLPG